MIRWDPGDQYEIAFTTRVGGVSEGPFESLNLGRSTRDAPEHVDENRRRLCATVGADPGTLSLNRQLHGRTVQRAQAGERARDGDGLWSDEPLLPMLAFSADCLPIALARTNGAAPALALLHAGRLGLLDGIVQSGVAALGGGRLAAIVGPGIGPCCYEVGEEIRAAYRARFGTHVLNGRNLDLWAAAGDVLVEAGVETVERLDICTACNGDRFFSHRRDGPTTGRQGVIGYVT